MQQIYVQSPVYDFSADLSFDKIREEAVKAIREEYAEEQASWQSEMQEMVDDGVAKTLDEAKATMLAQLSPTDVDFTKSFDENLNHPTVQMQINDLANKFMTNYRDLPSHLVVDVPDNAIGSKGSVDKSEALAAVNARFASVGITVTDFKQAGKATEQDLKKQKAFESVSKMFESGDYQTFLKLRASIQKYSANNISMIYMQKPQAQVVMGFNAWKDLGRSVASGQKALAIWQPLKKTLKSEAAIDKYIQKQADTFPSIYKQGVDSPALVKEREKLVKELEASTKKPKQVEIMDDMQLRNSVFDVSQTVPLDPTKDNIDDILKLNKPLDANVVGFDKIKAAIIEAGVITPIQIGSGKSQADAIWDALVKYADEAFKNPSKINGIKSVDAMKDDMHTIETIMAAYMIAEHIGIDTADKVGLALAKVFDDNQSRESLYMGRREMFMKGFDRSTKLSDMFVQDFDKAIGIDPEKTKSDIKAKIEAEAAERQAKAEQLKQQAEADKDKYTMFGITKMLKVDEWKADGVTYTIGLSQKTNMYFAKAVDDATKTNTYAVTGVDIPDKKKDPDGSKGIIKSVPIRFSEQPTREAIEYCIQSNKDGIVPDMNKVTFVSKDDKGTDAPAPVKDEPQDAPAKADDDEKADADVKQDIDSDDSPLGDADDGMSLS